MLIDCLQKRSNRKNKRKTRNSSNSVNNYWLLENQRQNSVSKPLTLLRKKGSKVQIKPFGTTQLSQMHLNLRKIKFQNQSKRS